MPKSYIAEVQCQHCQKLFSKRIIPGTKRHYCSKTCRMSDKNSYKSEWTDERRAAQSERNKGENNPNYGNTWSDELKQRASEIKKKQFAESAEYRYKAGASNRGKKFTADRIRAMHANRSSDSYRHPHSDETKKVIGKKSKEKWTEEFKQNHRNTMERLGHWIPIADQNPYKQYYKESNWIGSMIEFFNEDALANLKLHGIFSKINSKGFVRDHIVPRKVGYEFSLPPFIMRHPANLQFISHAENVKKGFADRRLTQNQKEAIISVLLNNIANFGKEWPEQEVCVKFIKERRLF